MKNVNAWLVLLASLLLMACSSGGAAVAEVVPEQKPQLEEKPEQSEEVEEGVDMNPVAVMVSTASRSKEFVRETFYAKSKNNSAGVITLNPGTRFQSMDGFGAAVTGSTCYNLLKMKQEDRTAFLKETFSDEEGLGFSYIRISIGCSDFSLSEYTCCDVKGIENFALQKEELEYVIPVLKEILAINPTLKIMGSPWTCPRWMKVQDLTSLRPYYSWTSGQLNPNYYQDYATYFVKWIQAFESHGIPIYSVTPQNEPLNRGNSASMYMNWDEEAEFVKTALGPKFVENNIKTKIYAYDHNYDVWDYPIKMYADVEAAEFLVGAAYHNYIGQRSGLLQAHNAAPSKELIFTETSIGMWNDGRNLSVRLPDDMRDIALGTVNNWCRAVIVWNLMLDSDMGPNRDGGCQTCYGAVDIERNDYKTITRNSHYFIIGHLSAVVKPGAYRISTSGGPSGITYSAFENEDDSYAFVALNDNESEQKIVVYDGTQYVKYDLPGKSVASFRWKKADNNK